MGKLNSLLEYCRIKVVYVVPLSKLCTKDIGYAKRYRSEQRLHNGIVIIVSLSPLRLWPSGNNAPDRTHTLNTLPDITEYKLSTLQETMQCYMRGYYSTNEVENKGGNGVWVAWQGLAFVWNVRATSAAQVEGAGCGPRGMLIDQPAPVARPDTPPPPTDLSSPSMGPTCVIKLTCGK